MEKKECKEEVKKVTEQNEEFKKSLKEAKTEPQRIKTRNKIIEKIVTPNPWEKHNHDAAKPIPVNTKEARIALEAIENAKTVTDRIQARDEFLNIVTEGEQ